jgi:hypothetical protein
MRKETIITTLLAIVLALVAVFLVCDRAHACGEIKPTPEVNKIVKRLAYRDFPQASDIFSIMRVESSMNPNAMTDSDRESSRGLMQVQNGPMEPRLNIAMGVSLLREYFMRTHSREGAVKSYNTGPANYLGGHMKLSAEAYYDKFKLQKTVYANYAKTGKLVYLGKTLGCGKENGIPLWLQERLKPTPKPILHKKHRG